MRLARIVGTLAWVSSAILSQFTVVALGEEPGLYGPCAGVQPEIKSAYSDVPGESWRDRPFAVVRSYLSPAWLIHSKLPEIHFFQNIEGPPAFIVFHGRNGTGTIRPGEKVSGNELSEPWLLASFAGAKGWESFDAPYLIVLQRRPETMDFQEKRLSLRFGRETGFVSCLPLYGYMKLPQPGSDFRKEHALPSLDLEPWTWREKGLPQKVLERCRWWSRAVRAYPIGLHETFSVDRVREMITVRQDIQWLDTADDWETQPLRVHPVPPTLGLAYLYPGFPVTFSREIHDPDYVTPYGPYLVAVDAPRLDIEYHVLQYINHTERPGFPECGAATAVGALDAVTPHLPPELKQEAEAVGSLLRAVTQPTRAGAAIEAMKSVAGKTGDDTLKTLVDEESRRIVEAPEPFQEKLATDALERLRKAMEDPRRLDVLIALRWLQDGGRQHPKQPKMDKEADADTLIYKVLDWLRPRLPDLHRKKVEVCLKRVKPLKAPTAVSVPGEGGKDDETGEDAVDAPPKPTVKSVTALLREVKDAMARPEQTDVLQAMARMSRALPSREAIQKAKDFFGRAKEKTGNDEARRQCAEAEAALDAQLQAPNNLIAWTALSRLRSAMDAKFASPDIYPYDHGIFNYVWAVMGDIWYPKALPYVPRERRAAACASLRLYFGETVLDPSTYSPFRHKAILHGPGIGSWGGWDDAGKIATNVLQTIWAYAHHTGDWDLVRDRWDLIRKLFITPEEMNWCMVGRAAIAEMGDEAPPCAALARLAWRVGDLDTYHFAAYVFAKELVHHYVKSMGADYFIRYQPFNHREVMKPPVFLTNFWGDTAGWQIDGPEFPKGTGERQYTNRWVRFHCEDTARFYVETPALREAVARELCDGVTGWQRFRDYQTQDASHILPSLIRVRSFLLNDSAEKLASITPPEAMRGYGSMLIAPMMSYIRAATPKQTIRLIPASGTPSPFVPGLERQAGRTGDLSLVQAMSWKKPWVNPRWFYWNTQFGTITPSDAAQSKESGGEWISPVTHVQWYAP